MIKRRRILCIGPAVAVAGLGGCGGGAGAGSSPGSGAAGRITGVIAVPTDRTDLVDDVLPGHVGTFEAKCPGTKVALRGATNDEGDVTTRLGSGDHGEEFLTGLAAAKERTGAVPFCTNYKDGWPLSEFNTRRAILGDPAINEKFPADPVPWQAGKIPYITDGLLYDMVRGGLAEKDPLTTNGEGSKPMLATGKAAGMVLGSWASHWVHLAPALGLAVRRLPQDHPLADEAGHLDRRDHQGDRDPRRVPHPFPLRARSRPGRDLDVAVPVQGPLGAQWGTIATRTTIVVIPTIVMFILLQRFLYNGIVAGAVK